MKYELSDKIIEGAMWVVFILLGLGVFANLLIGIWLIAKRLLS